VLRKAEVSLVKSAPTLILAGFGIAALSAAPLRAEQGRLLGWVEDTRGTPMAGVVISLFGKGLDGGGVVTLSDSAGRFFLPALPAGSYTIRALGGESGAAARKVTVLPNQDSVFTLNLQSEDEAGLETRADTSTDAPGIEDDPDDPLRQLRWLLRHKRRSVLEQRGQGVETGTVQRASLEMEPAGADAGPSVAGAVEVLANPLGYSDSDLGDVDASRASTSVVRLHGRLTDAISWSLAGLLAESETTTWRSAAEFLIEPGDGHQIEAGAGYGTRLLRPLFPLAGDTNRENHSMGALFIRDTVEISDRITASVGVRYSYIGFVADSNHINPSASIEARDEDGTSLRGTFAVHTVAPGGDLLTVSSLATAPDMVFALVDDELRPERVTRFGFELERPVGGTSIGLHAFHERVDDPLLNVASAGREGRSLRILNAPRLDSSGGGFSISHRIGPAVRGSFSYTYGRARRESGRPGPEFGLLDFERAGFHDVVARLETFLRQTDTRLVAFYRVNRLTPEGEGLSGQDPVVNRRFDVQLTQGLPFLAGMTQADWEVLVAYRNLFYEESEAAILDEVAVVDPPRRIMGGIAIRF
jgi:hypothetical protein